MSKTNTLMNVCTIFLLSCFGTWFSKKQARGINANHIPGSKAAIPPDSSRTVQIFIKMFFKSLMIQGDKLVAPTSQKLPTTTSLLLNTIPHLLSVYHYNVNN